jgi:hypothetical protein
VGTVRLLPADVATLVAGLTDGLAEISSRRVDAPTEEGRDRERLQEMEQRLIRIESRLRTPAWRTALPVVNAWTREAMRRGRTRWGGRRR